MTHKIARKSWVWPTVRRGGLPKSNSPGLATRNNGGSTTSDEEVSFPL